MELPGQTGPQDASGLRVRHCGFRGAGSFKVNAIATAAIPASTHGSGRRKQLAASTSNPTSPGVATEE
jgi:hypothetical protein